MPEHTDPQRVALAQQHRLLPLSPHERWWLETALRTWEAEQRLTAAERAWVTSAVTRHMEYLDL